MVVRSVIFVAQPSTVKKRPLVSPWSKIFFFFNWQQGRKSTDLPRQLCRESDRIEDPGCLSADLDQTLAKEEALTPSHGLTASLQMLCFLDAITMGHDGRSHQSQWRFTPVSMAVHTSLNGGSHQSQWPLTPVSMAAHASLEGGSPQSRWQFAPVSVAVHTSLDGSSHQSLLWRGPNCSPVLDGHPGRKPASCLLLLMSHLLSSSFYTEPCSTSPEGRPSPPSFGS